MTRDSARVHRASTKAATASPAQATAGYERTQATAKAAASPVHAQTMGMAEVVSSWLCAARDSAASRMTGAGRSSRGASTRMEPSASGVAASGAVRSMVRPEAVLARHGEVIAGASTRSVSSAMSSPRLELNGNATSASLWKESAWMRMVRRR